jgi:hypothetical protein
MVNRKISFFEFKQPDNENEKLQAAVHRKIRRCGYIAERVTCFQDCMDIINADTAKTDNLITGLKNISVALQDPELCSDTVWYNDTMTVCDYIHYLLHPDFTEPLFEEIKKRELSK